METTQKKRSTSMRARKRPQALVIDCQEAARKFFKSELYNQGFDVVVATQLESSFDIISTMIPDVVLLDPQGQYLSCEEFFARLDGDSSTQKIPVLIISADKEAELYRRTLEAGSIGFVQKPVERSNLANEIATASGRRGRRLSVRAPALILEDSKSSSEMISGLFDVLNIDAIICPDVATFKEYITVMVPDVITLDLVLPDGDGLTICKEIRSKDIFDTVPVVMISGVGDRDVMIDCLRSGASDFLNKPIITEEFFARMSNHLNLRRLQKELVQKQGELAALAFTDGLTALFNRAYFDQTLKKEIDRGRRSKSSVGLLIIDLDFFKKVNDTYGHEIGDAVLRETAEVIKNQIRNYDIACRYGGEEFAVILPGADHSNVITVAERIRTHCEKQLFSEKGIRQTMSIGATVFSEISTEDTIISDADKALYSAKHSGRNRTILAVKKDIDE